MLNPSQKSGLIAMLAAPLERGRELACGHLTAVSCSLVQFADVTREERWQLKVLVPCLSSFNLFSYW